jgi:hypothetical protein
VEEAWRLGHAIVQRRLADELTGIKRDYPVVMDYGANFHLDVALVVDQVDVVEYVAGVKFGKVQVTHGDSL